MRTRFFSNAGARIPARAAAATAKPWLRGLVNDARHYRNFAKIWVLEKDEAISEKH